MYLQVGGYNHEPNTVWLSPIIKQRVPSDRGRTMMYRHNWTVHCVLLGTSTSDLTSKINAYESAYKNINGDVVFRNDGGTPTAHSIQRANTINGIRASISYPGGLQLPGWGSGAEYTKVRYVVANLQAEELAIEDNILLYWQQVRFSLGGSKMSVGECLEGPPVSFITCQQSKFWAVQSGMAIGAYSNPSPGGSLFNVINDPDRSWVNTKSPQVQGTVNNIMFATNWSYYFESPFPLTAVPPPHP